MMAGCAVRNSAANLLTLSRQAYTFGEGRSMKKPPRPQSRSKRANSRVLLGLAAATWLVGLRGR